MSRLYSVLSQLVPSAFDSTGMPNVIDDRLVKLVGLDLKRRGWITEATKLFRELTETELSWHGLGGQAHDLESTNVQTLLDGSRPSHKIDKMLFEAEGNQLRCQSYKYRPKISQMGDAAALISIVDASAIQYKNGRNFCHYIGTAHGITSEQWQESKLRLAENIEHKAKNNSIMEIAYEVVGMPTLREPDKVITNTRRKGNTVEVLFWLLIHAINNGTSPQAAQVLLALSTIHLYIAAEKWYQIVHGRYDSMTFSYSLLAEMCDRNRRWEKMYAIATVQGIISSLNKREGCASDKDKIDTALRQPMIVIDDSDPIGQRPTHWDILKSFINGSLEYRSEFRYLLREFEDVLGVQDDIDAKAAIPVQGAIPEDAVDRILRKVDEHILVA